MDDKKLAFETAMTQVGAIAKGAMNERDYQALYSHLAEAWAAYDSAVDAASVKSVPTDKRWSLSVTLGLRKEG